ncbi:hypothetical Protein YC6258_03665 [Gynuella sunshinyii YC6258]|uniref:Uncharacterized protein n=1 Tax=Gynuella sunshinyii YC6258 TaxID=1445510 RepID=A0A0C5VN22_9GAMM|nr:hypothetical Protein YC6258_03665 [Gynuella sunshinyii YC6258]
MLRASFPRLHQNYSYFSETPGCLTIGFVLEKMTQGNLLKNACEDSEDSKKPAVCQHHRIQKRAL